MLGTFAAVALLVIAPASGAAGVAGRATLGAEIVLACGPAGTDCEGTGRDAAGAVPAAAVAGFASFFRKRPRATRNVPLACSTLIGLVSTRFAPMRKAFATPACPSTTATAS